MLVDRGIAVKHLSVTPACRFQDVQADFIGFVNEADANARAGILTGEGPVIQDIQAVLPPHIDRVAKPRMIVLFKTRGFVFTQQHSEDPCDLLNSWLDSQCAGRCYACVRLTGECASTCPRCAETTCIDCFPGLVAKNMERKFACPSCHLVRAAADAVVMMASPGTLTRQVWGGVRDALSMRAGREGTLVVANETRHVDVPFALTCRATVDGGGKVRLHTRHLGFARKALKTPGTVVAVGLITTDRAYEPDAIAKAFFVVDPKGNAREILKGWEYTFGCFVASKRGPIDHIL